MKAAYRYFLDFVALFFPELCISCGRNLFNTEHSVCTKCVFQLPRTRFHLEVDNPLNQVLGGLFLFENAGAFVYFRKGGKVQNIIHQLKYNNKRKGAFRMGELYANDLNTTHQWRNIDLIIPVPLHPKREKERGYNQSEYIAQGLASVLDIPVSTQNLIRGNYTSTQTKKSRFARYENMKEAFHVQNKADLEGKHILLVDDVITTGATLAACATTLLALKGVRMSVAAIAFAG